MSADDWNAGAETDQAMIDRTIAVAAIVLAACAMVAVLVVAWMVRF